MLDSTDVITIETVHGVKQQISIGTIRSGRH
jgi:hypothetical protein